MISPWALGHNLHNFFGVKLIRFCGVGVISSGLYVANIYLLVDIFSVYPESAAIISYFISIPVSFLGHKYASFKSTKPISTELIRFLAMHTISLTVSVTAMNLSVTVLKISHLYGAVFAVILVPLICFLMMNYWVFR